jgi:hypothetical protein
MSKVINNFAGLNGFVWWMGVVENRMDPLKVGRCQVRIFGWHTENTKLIPSEDLPWCMPLYPLNRSKDFSTPKEGDYVVGFFLDSESGQAPVMMGVLPGIQSQAAAGDSGFQDQRTAKEISAGPQIPEGQVQSSVGQPTIVPLARGIVANSAISATNSARSAVPNIVTPIKATIAAAKAQAIVFLQEIRLAKDAIIASFIAPGAGILNSVATVPIQIATQVEAYAQQAVAVADAVTQVQAVVQDVASTLSYIEGLPAATIAQINSEVNLPGQTGGLLNDITSEVNSTVSKLQNTIA